MPELTVNSERDLWTRVCTIDDLPARGGRSIRCGQIDIALFRLSHDAIAAIEDRCPHKDGKLSEGIVSDHTVTCPLHNWRIDLIRGEATEPDKGCVRRFPVEVRNGEIFLDLSAQDAPIPTPLADQVGRHPDTGRPKLGRRRATAKDFSIHDFNREIPVLAVEPPSPHTAQTYTLQLTDTNNETTTLTLDDITKNFETIQVPAHITCLMFNFTHPVTWTGIRLADLLATITTPYEFGSFYSWDTTETTENERFFETLPRNYMQDPRTLLTFGMNGHPLPKDHGGPLRLAIPFLQGYKSVKWLTDIHLTHQDQIGYKKKHGFIEFPEFDMPAK